MGVVYHAHYLDYFEYGRTEALRQLGVPYKDVEAAGIIMPVVDLSVKYKRPAKYDDTLEIVTNLGHETPTIKVPITYEVFRQSDDELIVTGLVTLCCVDAATGKPVLVPALIADAFTRALADGDEGRQLGESRIVEL